VRIATWNFLPFSSLAIVLACFLPCSVNFDSDWPVNLPSRLYVVWPCLNR